MHSKEHLEQLAKDCAFEYDPKPWNKVPHEPRQSGRNGEIIVFYKNHHIYNGVIALWARDNSHAVVFYSTPHDVADEKKMGWVAPVFRVELNCHYLFDVPKNPKAIDYLEDSNGGEYEDDGPTYHPPPPPEDYDDDDNLLTTENEVLDTIGPNEVLDIIGPSLPIGDSLLNYWSNVSALPFPSNVDLGNENT